MATVIGREQHMVQTWKTQGECRNTKNANVARVGEMRSANRLRGTVGNVHFTSDVNGHIVRWGGQRRDHRIELEDG